MPCHRNRPIPLCTATNLLPNTPSFYERPFISFPVSSVSPDEPPVTTKKTLDKNHWTLKSLLFAKLSEEKGVKYVKGMSPLHRLYPGRKQHPFGSLVSLDKAPKTAPKPIINLDHSTKARCGQDFGCVYFPSNTDRYQRPLNRSFMEARGIKNDLATSGSRKKPRVKAPKNPHMQTVVDNDIDDLIDAFGAMSIK